MRDITDKVAWITGAGTGVGQAAAVALAREGVRTVLTGRRREPLEETAAMIAETGPEALALPVDVSDHGAVNDALAEIIRQRDRIDILVNNAGLNIPNRHWSDVTSEGWRKVIEVNLDGPFNCVSAVLPKMREQGEGLIINVSSWSGRFHDYVAGPAYSASKHALMSMNASINIEEGTNGIRSCAICPEEIATPMAAKRPVKVSEETLARMLQPEDIGELIVAVARMHPRVCVNEIVVNPTWCRSYLGEPGFFPPKPDG